MALLKIASYSLRGQVVRVKLRCSCGDGKIFEVQEEGKTYYFCNKCRTRKTVDELKKEASTYWRGRDWIVECEADQRTLPRIHVDFPVELTVKATRYSPAYCQLHGNLVVLSLSGTLAVVTDFQEAFFKDITSTYRQVEIATAKPVESFPPQLSGRIVGVRFRPDELPQCRIGIGFEDLSEEASEALRAHIAKHIEDTTDE
jgi:hypothetical protein